MSFLSNSLNKPKIGNGKKPVIKVPKIEPKITVKPEPVVEEMPEVKAPKFEEATFTPFEEAEAVIEEPKTEEEVTETIEETPTESVEEVESAQETFASLLDTAEETNEDTVEETKEEESTETVEEPETVEEVVKEVEVKEESKPKKRKRASKKKEEVVEEATDSLSDVVGNTDVSFVEEYMEPLVNPTSSAWEEEKAIVNHQMDEVMIDSDMGSAEMDEMISKLSHLENDVRQRLDEIAPLFFNIRDLVEFIELTAGVGSNAAERKAAGKIACTRYVKAPGEEPVNLYVLFNFQRARYEFYRSKMEQIKNENGRLITLSAVKKLECSLSR